MINDDERQVRECQSQDNNALIPRSYVITAMANMHKYVSDRMNEIAEYQAVLVSDVRNKAIDETIKAIKAHYDKTNDDEYFNKDWIAKDLNAIVQQLKEGS